MNFTLCVIETIINHYVNKIIRGFIFVAAFFAYCILRILYLPYDAYRRAKLESGKPHYTYPVKYKM